MTKISEISQIGFQITNRCNLNCEFCFAKSGYVRKNELRFNEIKQCIDVFMNYHLESIYLTGGEPLFRRSISKETLEYVSEHGVTTRIFTNGTTVSRSFAKELRECNLKCAQVTIDGPSAAIHDKIIGRGTFKKAIRAIKYLQEFGIDIDLRSTIFKMNYHVFSLIFELAKYLNVQSLSVRPFWPLGRGFLFAQKYMPSHAQRGTAIRSLLVQRQKWHGYPKIVFLPSCFEFLYPEYHRGDEVRLCQHGRKSIFIDCVGNIMPCGHFPGVLGSIRGDQSIKINIQNVLNQSEILREIDLPPSAEMCAKCSSWDLCKRSCYSLTYGLTGSVHSAHPYCPKRYIRDS